MSDLSDKDIERLANALAPRLVRQVKATHHAFWIDPEKHYTDHLQMRQLAEAFTPEAIAALREVMAAFRFAKGFTGKVILYLVIAVGILAGGIYYGSSFFHK